MVRPSNIILAIFNWITLVIGLGAMATGLYFVLTDTDTACQNGLEDPLFIVGASLTVISLLGLIGACFGANFFLVIYLGLLFCAIVGLICFTIFTILVTNASAGKMFSSSKAFNFQNWLKNHFVDNKNWVEVKSCLMDANVCTNPAGPKTLDFYRDHLTSIQAGCCRPPVSCGFIQQNATSWARPKRGPAPTDKDCNTWSNSLDKMCYDCEICKIGFVDSIRKQWRYLAIFNACATVLVIIVYTIGCCVKQNNKEDSKYKYRGYA